MEEEVFVGLHHFHQVVLADRFFPGSVFLFQSFLQDFGRGLQVDDEVGRWQLVAERIEVAIVGFQFVVVEVEAGKQLVFLENIVRDDGLVRART